MSGHPEMDLEARLVPMCRNRHTTFIRKESHEILVDVNSVKLAVAAKKGSGFDLLSVPTVRQRRDRLLWQHCWGHWMKNLVP